MALVAWPNTVGAHGIIINLAIASNTNNYNVFTAAGSPSLPVTLNLTVNGGVVVGSSSIASPAMDWGVGWPAGSHLNFTNSGTVIGEGGTGGTAVTGALIGGNAGGNAGDAIWLRGLTVAITNNGVIGGGGGGGGSGANWDGAVFGNPNPSGAGGNGGGFGSVAASSTGGNGEIWTSGVDNGPSAGGPGGAAGSNGTKGTTTATGGSAGGGGGGGLGATGGAGGDATASPGPFAGGAGGSPGSAIVLAGGTATFVVAGLVYGAVA